MSRKLLWAPVSSWFSIAPNSPWSTAKVTPQLCTTDLHRVRRILELLICLVIALGISYCLFIPRDLNITVCSDLVSRCENSWEGVLVAQRGRAEQRPPLSASSCAPGLTAWQFQCCSPSAAGWQDRGWNSAWCTASAGRKDLCLCEE